MKSSGWAFLTHIGPYHFIRAGQSGVKRTACGKAADNAYFHDPASDTVNSARCRKCVLILHGAPHEPDR